MVPQRIIKHMEDIVVGFKNDFGYLSCHMMPGYAW
jgi:hypothetical protein